MMAKIGKIPMRSKVKGQRAGVKRQKSGGCR